MHACRQRFELCPDENMSGSVPQQESILKKQHVGEEAESNSWLKSPGCFGIKRFSVHVVRSGCTVLGKHNGLKPF